MSYPIIQKFEDRPLAETLKILLLPLVARRHPFRQLEYVRTYVRDLGCSTVLIEGEYVDRDYMQDHSVFYSTSFAQYPPVCRRLHFFKDVAAEDLAQQFDTVASAARHGTASYDKACKAFSQ